jgi:hypothetical protein
VTTQANEGAVQHHMTPEVLRLSEGLEVLEHQVACSLDGVDRLTLLVEPTPSRAPAWRAATARQVLSALPPFAGRMVHWCEVDDDDGVRWVPAQEAGQRTVQRRAVSVVGAGARAVIGHLVGHALFTVRGLAGAIDESVVLVAIELLEGDDVTTVVAARDVEATRARETRREGRATAPEVATVTLRGRIDLESKESSLEHVATGLAAEKTESICAAMLRAQR